MPFAASTLSHAILLEASPGAELQVQEGKVIKLQARTRGTDSTASLWLSRFNKREMRRPLCSQRGVRSHAAKDLAAYRIPGCLPPPARCDTHNKSSSSHLLMVYKGRVQAVLFFSAHTQHQALRSLKLWQAEAASFRSSNNYLLTLLMRVDAGSLCC